MRCAVYWIWLQQALGYGAEKIRYIVDIFGDAENFYNSMEKRKEDFSRYFTPIEMKKIKETKIESAVKILNECEKLGYNIISYDMEAYPYRLRMIQDPPAVLYVWGDLPDIDKELVLAMVGPRKATHGGYRNAIIASYRLALGGALIVSGCAPGVDTASHKGCLQAGGKTIAVLGCGLNYRYNMENAKLREVISKRGAVISEYPPGVAPLRCNFPQRNRIISGLALGAIVVEAGAKSGSLITARHAAEQGKDIFAFPGNVENKYMFGTNTLIRDGATPVMCPLDVLSIYVLDFAPKMNLEGMEIPFFEELPEKMRRARREVKPQKKPIDASASQEAKAAYDVIGFEPMHIDVITEKAGITAAQTLSAITELEILGAIKSMSGKRYYLEK